MTARTQDFMGHGCLGNRAWLAAWCAALVLLLAPAAQAAEFVTPPGQNVGMQEDQLRERVTRIAKDLAGDKVVDVVVHIGFVRQEKTQVSAGSERVKLPGLNNYVSGKAGNVEVTPEFIRLRQVLVVVSSDIGDRAKALERDIRSQGQLDPTRGDWVQVAPVSVGGGEPSFASTKPKEPGKPEEPKPDATPQEVQRSAAAFKPKEDLLKEPQSTLYLINARAAYFKGDYNTALDQILQSIQAKADNPQAYAMMGSLYYAMNWKSLALKYWEKSLALDMGNRELEGLVTQLRLEKN
jgi:tetratricopeptide (TPR) repeat protein